MAICDCICNDKCVYLTDLKVSVKIDIKIRLTNNLIYSIFPLLRTSRHSSYEREDRVV